MEDLAVSFIVSTSSTTSSNEPRKKSGLIEFTYENGRLSESRKLHQLFDSENRATIEQFCYIKPKEFGNDNLPDNGKNVNKYDYLIVARSSGFLEIICNFQYKLRNHLSLKSDFVIKCVPENFDVDYTAEYKIIGLEYRDKLLYCCTDKGQCYITVLNLPSTHIQTENYLFESTESQNFSELLKDTLSIEETNFEFITKYKSDYDWQHICFFLLPLENDHYDFIHTPQSSQKPNHVSIIYRTSMFFSCGDALNQFKINPYNKFSIIYSAESEPLVVVKILLHKDYVTFLETLTRKKTDLQKSLGCEVTTWKNLPTEFGLNSIFEATNCLRRALRNANSTSWMDLALIEGTALPLKHRAWRGVYLDSDSSASIEKDENGISATSILRPPGRRLRRRRVEFFNRRTLIRSASLRARPSSLRSGISNCSENGELSLSKQAVSQSVTSFGFIHTTANADDTISHNDENDYQSSLLPKNYRSLNVICVDGTSTYRIFQPALQMSSTTTITSFCDQSNTSFTASPYTTKSFLEYMTFNHLGLYKKLYIINNMLSFIVASNGIIVLNTDSKKLNNNNLFSEDKTVKAAGCNLKGIENTLLIVNSLEFCNLNHACKDYELFFTLIGTSESNSILCINGHFKTHEKLGKITVTDSVQAKNTCLSIDKLKLTSFQKGSDRSVD